jgi:hypothetical protein
MGSEIRESAACPELDIYLGLAADCCSRMLKLYEDIRKAVAAGSSSDVLTRYIREMKQVGEKSIECASIINKTAEKSGIEPGSLAGYAYWQQLLAQTLEENRNIKRHVQGALAVAKNELDRMRAGKQALCGYHSGRGKDGAAGINIGRKINCGV